MKTIFMLRHVFPSVIYDRFFNLFKTSLCILPSLLFLSSMSPSRLMSLLFARFRFSPAGILISTHVLSPNLSIVNCVLSKIKPAVQIGSDMSGSETVCVFFGVRTCIQKLYEAGSASEKTTKPVA
jgi:hypothetical protein